MADEYINEQDIPAPSHRELAALAEQCQCGGCKRFRNALERVLVDASQGGMASQRLALNVAAVVGATIGQLAVNDHASDFVDEVAARMKPFAEMANRAAQAADLREALEGSTVQ